MTDTRKLLRTGLKLVIDEFLVFQSVRRISISIIIVQKAALCEDYIDSHIHRMGTDLVKIENFP